MAVPYLDLTKQLNAEGFPLTYSEVLLVSDWYEGFEQTSLMRAARSRAHELGVTPRILGALHAEQRRRKEVERANGSAA